MKFESIPPHVTYLNSYVHDSFVCLFVKGLSSHSRISHSYGDVTITGDGL